MSTKTKTARNTSDQTATATPAQRAASALAALLTDAPEDIGAQDVRKVGKAFRAVAVKGCATPAERRQAEEALTQSWAVIEATYNLDSDDAQEGEAQREIDRLTDKITTMKADLKVLQGAKVAMKEERIATGVAMRAAGWGQGATARVLGVSGTSVRNWTQAAEAEAQGKPKPKKGAKPKPGAGSETAPTVKEVLAALDRVADMVYGITLTPDAHGQIAASLTNLMATIDAHADAEADAA